MDGAVKDGLVTPDKPIKFTDCEVVRYNDIPQQNDGTYDLLNYSLLTRPSLLKPKLNTAGIHVRFYTEVHVDMEQ